MTYASWVPAGIRELHKSDMKAWKKLDAKPYLSHSREATPPYLHMEKLLSSSSFENVWKKLLTELRARSNNTVEMWLQPHNLTKSEVVLFSILISCFSEVRQNFFLKTKLSLKERSAAIKRIEKNLKKIETDLDLLGIKIRGSDIIANVDETYSFRENYGLLSNALIDAPEDTKHAFHIAMRSLLFSDFFNEVTTPTILSRLGDLEGIGSISKTDSLEKRVCAYMLVESFKMNLGKELKTHAATIIQVLFDDSAFDEGRLAEAIKSISEHGRLKYPNFGNIG